MPPPPPPPLPKKIPPKGGNTWIRATPLAAPQILRGDLYIRRDDSLDMAITGSLTLITSCLTSLEWLMYLYGVKRRRDRELQFDTHFITDDESPRFETNGHIYHNLNEFDETHSSISLEPEIAEMNETWRNSMMEALMKVKRAFLVGYRLLCRPGIEWLTRELDGIRTLLSTDNYAMIEQILEQQMREACHYLSSQLGKHKNFVSALRNTLDAETTTFDSLSILDIQLAASGILIRKCFEIENVSTYVTTIHKIFYGYISLWAHSDIIYLYSIHRLIEPLDFTATLCQNPELLASTVREAGAHVSGGQGDVYKVSLQENNIWGLDSGDYAFKVSRGCLTTGISHNSVKSEVAVLQATPFENMTKAVGTGTGLLNDRQVFFFAMKWISGGNLYDRMEDLNLSQIRKVLKGIAYALHWLYTSSCGCVVDLKPENVLLDENDSPVLCDFGLFTYSGTEIGSFCGTSLYHNETLKATHGRDIFAYGVIIFQLLTDAVRGSLRGIEIASKIRGYVDEHKDLGTFIKPRLQNEAHVARRLLDIGVDCLEEDEDLRPSALEIYER